MPFKKLSVALLTTWALSAQAFSPGGFLKAIKAAKPATVIEIGSVTAKELRLGTKADNVLDLLELAKTENRLDDVRALQLERQFQTIDNGDKLLLRCLQSPACVPERFISTARKSQLHAEVVMRAPLLNETLVNHEVGRITENMMTRYFTDAKWEQLEGQIGRTGIDGLFVFRKNGQIRDLLVVESKYKGSLLQETNFGTQMSKDWIIRKLEQLQTQHPTNPDYPILKQMVSDDRYRGILWSLDAREDQLLVTLSRTHSKGGNVIQAPLPQADHIVFGATELQRIRLTGQQNPFEATMANWYREELSTVGR